MSDGVEQQARELLRAAALEARLIPDPYGRLMRRARRQQRARVAGVSILALAGVALTALVQTEITKSSHQGNGTPTIGLPKQLISATASVGSSSPSPSWVPQTTPTILTRDDVVRHFLQSNSRFIQNVVIPSFGGRVYCGIATLARSSDGTKLYDWFYCQEFYDASGTLGRGSAVSGPILLRIEGSGAQSKVVAWQVPRNGSQYEHDVRLLFPPDVAEKILTTNGAVEVTPSEAQLVAEARTDLARGLL